MPTCRALIIPANCDDDVRLVAQIEPGGERGIGRAVRGPAQQYALVAYHNFRYNDAYGTLWTNAEATERDLAFNWRASLLAGLVVHGPAVITGVFDYNFNPMDVDMGFTVLFRCLGRLEEATRAI